ncbi:hypothetical protein [Micromonospora sp. KC721]|uniref:hypothetical protein n=1 Tax=Micromonospora sp. KC721 TaxID=2530380 RepID=UPI001FB5F557|nr:hypothetical protein [Micromonospora sp. KC721]
MVDRTPETTRGRRAGGSGRSGTAARLRGGAGGLVARVPGHWRYAMAVFVAAKIIFAVLGVVALAAWDEVPGTPPADEADTRAEQAAISPRRWISMWFAWDALIYDHLAREPLTGPWDDFAFPLLYPFLARPVAVLLGGDTALALLLIANVAFLLLLYYALRLGEILLGDDRSARRFTRYLVLLPTAFLFQAALTESLFLCLAVATFYYAERRRWLVVGLVGYLLGLSRSVGFLVVVPLALVLLRQHRYRLGPRTLWAYLRSGWPLLLIPAGWLTFMAFCRWKGGDWFAYKHAQEKGWGISVQDPLRVMWQGLTGGDGRDAVRVWFAVAVLAVVLAGFRRIGLPYVVYAVLMVLAPLSMGPPVYKSLLRYLLAAFPVCLVLARWTRTAGVDVWLSVALALLQGVLFVIWLAYWTHFII